MTCTNVVKEKTPSSNLDYKFDWAPVTNNAIGAVSDWLASGETITLKTVTVPAGITKVSDTLTDSDTSVTVRLSGGTVPANYDIACYIETSAGNKETMTMTIRMVEKKSD